MTNIKKPSSLLRLAVLGTSLVAITALTLGACSKDSNSDATTTTTSTTETTAAPSTTVDAAAAAAAAAEAAKEARVLVDKNIQAQLTVVGCYKGKDDGVIGKQTDEAIILFQTASGLTVDGELGPKTDAALTAAANSKKVVCTATTVTTKAPATTVPRNNPPCTAAAISGAIAPNTVNGYICGNNFAAGSQSNGDFDSAFLLAAGDDNSGQWVVIPTDAATCADKDIPAAVLAESPCKVS
ncbi:MAG: hypothetical protein F2694_10150 [Actinobacteria bacterium]|uniref:Unannotated protein n=1 Tax=freshwater metagenome TaxID=449393 RepID=A0A6J6UG95_9ZZZZ|nr:hypothetical protein [Actinomycetota bacterium]